MRSRFSVDLDPMGDWCRQVGTTRSETDTANSKETTAKEKMGMTLLIRSTAPNPDF